MPKPKLCIISPALCERQLWIGLVIIVCISKFSISQLLILILKADLLQPSFIVLSILTYQSLCLPPNARYDLIVFTAYGLSPLKLVPGTTNFVISQSLLLLSLSISHQYCLLTTQSLPEYLQSFSNGVLLCRITHGTGYGLDTDVFPLTDIT